MFYAVQHPDLLLIVAADALLDFETFANECGDGTNGYTVERADILDMLGDTMFKGYSNAPIKVMVPNDAARENAIRDFNLTIVRPAEGIHYQETMIERAKLEANLNRPPDRRTLGEIYDLIDNDPWDNSTEEQRKAGKKEDERMRALREAGGLTGDSFASKMGDKLNIHDVEAIADKDGNITSISIDASKNTIATYEIIVDGDDFDYTPIWVEMRLPDNRILFTSGNRVVIDIHDFQTSELSDALDRAGRTYSIVKQTKETVEDAFEIDHDTASIFYSVQIEHGTVHDMIILAGVQGIDISTIVAMRNVEEGCWLAFLREASAVACADMFNHNGHASAVVAINKKGRALIEGNNGEVRVIDTNAHIDIGPRPWNDRSGEIDAMTDDEKAEWRKTVLGAEYLITIKDHPKYTSVCYIVPESYFRIHDDFWEGEMILDWMPRDAGNEIFTKLSAGVYSSRLSAQLLKDNLCRAGAVESLLLCIYINNLASEREALLS